LVGVPWCPPCPECPCAVPRMPVTSQVRTNGEEVKHGPRAPALLPRLPARIVIA
jgi:hypothetical protein